MSKPRVSDCNDDARNDQEYTLSVADDPDLSGELSDVDLEHVHGGLERIHFPQPIDYREAGL